jgi:ABC-type multidrug transport system fused ATPase/permease subunit
MSHSPSLSQLHSVRASLRLKQLYAFLGARTLFHLSVGALVGLSLFVVEFLFAYLLQAFLGSIGAMDTGQVSIPAWIPHGSLETVLLGIGLAGLAKGILGWAQTYLSSATVEHNRRMNRDRVITWALHSESASSADVFTLLSDRVPTASGSLLNVQVVSVFFPAALCLGAGLFWLSPAATLITIAFLSVLWLGLSRLDQAISHAGRQISILGQQLNRRMLTNVRNLILMHIYGTETAEETKAKANTSSILGHSLTYARYMALKFSVPQTAGIFLICAITLLSSQGKLQGLAPSHLIIYFYLFIRFVQYFSDAGRQMSAIRFAWPQVVELARWWSQHSFDGVRNRQDLRRKQRTAEPFSAPLGWKLNHVSFSYDTGAKIFDQLSLEVAPGSSLVITGASGSGKSTLVQLLLGMSRPTSGSIELTNGSDGNVPLQSAHDRLLRSMGYVGAESFIVEGSIRDNLLYGLSWTVTEQQIWDALKSAEATFVEKLQGGLEYPLTDQGQGLSAGQKQRLGLARALLRAPKVLLLDEATSNLDEATESKLIQTFSRLKGELTLVVVTHRKSLEALADQRLDLDSARS